MTELARQEDVTFLEKVDKLAQLHQFLASYQEEYDRLKKEISETVNMFPDRNEMVVRGYNYNLKFSASSQQSVVPKELTSAEIFDRLGFSALVPSVTAIKTVEATRNREYGFSPSILETKWGSRKLIGAFENI